MCVCGPTAAVSQVEWSGDLVSGDILQVVGELTVMWWQPSSHVLPPLYCMCRPSRSEDVCIAPTRLAIVHCAQQLQKSEWRFLVPCLPAADCHAEAVSQKGTCLVPGQRHPTLAYSQTAVSMTPALLQNPSAKPHLTLQSPLPAADCHARAGPQRGPLHQQNFLQDGLPHGQQLQGSGSPWGTWPCSVPGCLGVWQALGAGFSSEAPVGSAVGWSGAEAWAADVGCCV